MKFTPKVPKIGVFVIPKAAGKLLYVLVTERVRMPGSSAEALLFVPLRIPLNHEGGHQTQSPEEKRGGKIGRFL